jgi:hypothetical protein
LRVHRDTELMPIRLRLPEVLGELTPYEVAKRSEGRIIEQSLYRLVRRGGRVRMLDGELIDALCDVLGLEPAELLERESPRRRVR